MTCIPCNQCKYFKTFDRCDHPNTYTIIDYVTCEKAQDYIYCRTWRTSNLPWETCGVKAKWFEQKASEPMKYWWKFWE